jgi:hypothetical protein
VFDLLVEARSTVEREHRILQAIDSQGTVYATRPRDPPCLLS